MTHTLWGVGVTDMSGRLTSASNAFASMHQRKARELIGSPLVEVVAPECRAKFHERIRELDRLGALRWESKHVRQDGSYFPAAIDATAVRDETGELISRAFFVQDITERKRQDDSRRTLFELAPDGIFIADGFEGRYIDVNPAACQMLGYSREQLIGKTRADLVLAAQLTDGIHERERALQGLPVSGEIRLRRADGSTILAEVHGRLSPDGLWQSIARDITQRKQVEAALAASEEKFRRIVSAAADAIILVDEHQRILLFNEQAEQIFGFQASDMLGCPVELLLPEDQRARHAWYVDEFRKSGDTKKEMSPQQSVRGRRHNGEEFPAQASVSSIQIDGQQIFAVVLRDISRQIAALDREKFMNELGGVLAASLDAEQTLGELARRVVRHFADFCLVDLMHPEGLRRLHATARDPDSAWVSDALHYFPLDPALPRIDGLVVQTHEPEIAELTQQYLSEHSQGMGHLALLKAMKARSVLNVPMLAQGQLKGVLTAISRERIYNQQDQELMMQVAERAAMALENATLHGALRQAHLEAQARIVELQKAHEKIKTLTGLLPVCAWCGEIRDEQQGGTWKRFDQYVSERGAAEVSHGICPSCASKHLGRASPRAR